MDSIMQSLEAVATDPEYPNTNLSTPYEQHPAASLRHHVAVGALENTRSVTADEEPDSLGLPTPRTASSFPSGDATAATTSKSVSRADYSFLTDLLAKFKIAEQRQTKERKIFSGGDTDDASDTENENESEDSDPQPTTPSTELKLRDYQKELAKPALHGHNVLICSPTGSGKTEVAISVALHHLNSNSDERPVRIAFLVKTQALARQQFQRFRKYYKPCRVKCLVGGANGPNTLELSACLQNFDVFVMTAGIFRNALEKNESPVRFEDFRLIIFDEAHSAVKGSDYARILRMYAKRKKELQASANSNGSSQLSSTTTIMEAQATNSTSSVASISTACAEKSLTSKDDSGVSAGCVVENSLPQIIGLTASPGTEKASNFEEALDHVIRLCAMLDAKISIVRECKESLDACTNKTESRHEECSLRDPDRFRVLLVQEMAYISNEVNQRIEQNKEQVLVDLDNQPVTAPGQDEYGTTSYSSKIGALRKVVRKLSNQQLTRDLQICADWLRMYNICLVLNSAVLHRHAVAYMKEQMSLRGYNYLHVRSRDEALGAECLKDIKCRIIVRFFFLLGSLIKLAESETDTKSTEELFSDLLPPISSVGDAELATELNSINEAALYYTKVENGKLKRLKDEVLGLFKRKPDSRVLIFVQERYACIALLDWFNNDTDLACFNAVRLSGHAKTSAGGQSAATAKASLDRFRNGDSKVMITTSVAEEGVDIPQCNLVIRYQYVKDEVALVQVRGRCRSSESECVLIYDKANEALALKDRENEIRNRLMEEALVELCAMDEETFKKRVENFQREILLEECASSQNPTSLQSLDSGVGDDEAWQVLCGRCHVLLAHHTRILRACGAHHIVLDENVYDRVCARPLAKPRPPFGDSELIGDAICKNCCFKFGDEKKLGKIVRIGLVELKRLYALLSAEDIAFRAPGSPKIRVMKKWKDAKSYFEVRDAKEDDLSEFSEKTKNKHFLPPDECKS